MAIELIENQLNYSLNFDFTYEFLERCGKNAQKYFPNKIN